MLSSSFIVFSNTSSSWGFNTFCPAFFYYMFPIIFTSFIHRFLHHFLWFPAFSYLFNININPRVLPVSFIFRSFLHHFLSLLSHFPALSLYFSNMFTASSWFASLLFDPPSHKSLEKHSVSRLSYLFAHLHPLRFPPFSKGFSMVCSSHSLRFRPFSRGFCTISSDRYHVLLQFHCIFQYILMVSPATKKADLGGIDTPPSANCLVVHNPAKCSVFSRSTQGHCEISFPFGNHPPPHPLFSLRSQTATSQLYFRNIEKQKHQRWHPLHATKLNALLSCYTGIGWNRAR